MLGPAVWIVALLTQAGHDVRVSAPPQSLDPRLVFEQIAREPRSSRPRAWRSMLAGEFWSTRATPTSGPRITLAPRGSPLSLRGREWCGRRVASGQWPVSSGQWPAR